MSHGQGGVSVVEGWAAGVTRAMVTEASLGAARPSLKVWRCQPPAAVRYPDILFLS